MKKIFSTLFPVLYICWAIVAISLTFYIGGLSNDNLTHIVILVLLIFSLGIFCFLNPVNPGRFFISSCVMLAALGEGAYMISKPVLDSLLVPRDAKVGLFLHHYVIDLAFTLPAYVLIFFVIWKLITTFRYSRWEYIFLVGLGQAIGDGSSFFLMNPGLVWLIPFIMLNYHAMNVAPYLRIEKFLSEKNRRDSKWKYPLTLGAVFASYFFSGTVIKIAARALGMD